MEYISYNIGTHALPDIYARCQRAHTCLCVMHIVTWYDQLTVTRYNNYMMDIIVYGNI